MANDYNLSQFNLLFLIKETNILSSIDVQPTKSDASLVMKM